MVILGICNFHETAGVCSWYLWWERRKLVHKDLVQGANSVARSYWALASNFNIENDPNAPMERGGWCNPSNGYVKLNVDATFGWDMLHGAMGAIIIYDRNQMITAATLVMMLSHQGRWHSSLGLMLRSLWDTKELSSTMTTNDYEEWWKFSW